MVVNNSMDNLTFPRPFDPKKYLIERHGQDTVHVVDCEKQTSTVSSLGAVLSTFDSIRSSHQPILKVKVSTIFYYGYIWDTDS